MSHLDRRVTGTDHAVSVRTADGDCKYENGTNPFQERLSRHDARGFTQQKFSTFQISINFKQFNFLSHLSNTASSKLSWDVKIWASGKFALLDRHSINYPNKFLFQHVIIITRDRIGFIVLSLFNVREEYNLSVIILFLGK